MRTLLFNPLEFDTISDTAWEDSEVTSYVIEKTFEVAKGFLVERVEYLNQLPALWPILEQPTAFILDLRDPKYNLYDKDGDLYRVDALVKNKVSVRVCLLTQYTMTYNFLRTRIHSAQRQEPAIAK